MLKRTYRVTGPLDLRRTLAPLSHGAGDSTIRFGPGRIWWATRTVDGPVALALGQTAGAEPALTVEAHGPGAERALATTIPGLLGDLDGAPAVIALAPHPLVARLARVHPGVRIPRTGAVIESLVPAILEQKVTSGEAHRAWAGLIRTYGEPAPGPAEWRLRVPPAPATLAALPYFAYHPFGVEQRRAELIRRVAARAAWFEEIVDMPLEQAYARLRSMPGSARGRPPKWVFGRWETRTPSASATSICHTSSRSRSPESRGGRTRGCSSSSSPTAGNAPASSASSR